LVHTAELYELLLQVTGIIDAEVAQLTLRQKLGEATASNEVGDVLVALELYKLSYQYPQRLVAVVASFFEVRAQLQ